MHISWAAAANLVLNSRAASHLPGSSLSLSLLKIKTHENTNPRRGAGKNKTKVLGWNFRATEESQTTFPNSSAKTKPKNRHQPTHPPIGVPRQIWLCDSWPCGGIDPIETSNRKAKTQRLPGTRAQLTPATSNELLTQTLTAVAAGGTVKVLWFLLL
jgi:hypothetical protein